MGSSCVMEHNLSFFSKLKVCLALFYSVYCLVRLNTLMIKLFGNKLRCCIVSKIIIKYIA